MAQQGIVVRNEDGSVETLDLYNNTRKFRDENGKLVTMDLGNADVHIDQALANYAAGYKFADRGLIADFVAPVVPVPKASDKYYTWDKDDVFQEAEDLIVGQGASPREINPRLSSTTFSTLPFGASAAVPTELSANADAPLQIEQMYMARPLTALRLAREIRVASLATSSSNWTNGYTTTLGATQKWNSGSASNPVQDILTGIENSLTPVNFIAMSEQVQHDFVQNAQVQKYIASKVNLPPLPLGAPGDVTASVNAQISAILELPPIHIGRRKKKLTASTYGYVWGSNVVLGYAEPGMPMNGQSISTFKTFRWSQADAGVPDGTVQGGFMVRSYFDPRRGARGSRVIVVAHNDAEISTSVFAGGLLINAHQ